jgi:Tfp pilus assembly PilM family ATPase
VAWTQALELAPANEDYTFGAERKTLNQLFGEHHIHGDYVAVLIGTGAGMFRLIHFPGRPADDAILLQQVRQTMGVADDQEVRCRLLPPPTQPEKAGKPEFAVMAAAMPEEVVRKTYDWLIGSGLTPVSLQVPGVAVANLVGAAAGQVSAQHSVGFLELSTRTSLLMILDEGDLALARQFKFGNGVVLEKLKSQFELDQGTALKFYESGSFDFSADVKPLMNPWLHQLSISLDYFERRSGHPVSSLFLFGSGSCSKVVEQILAEYIRRPLAAWEPLSALPAGLALPAHAQVAKPAVFAAAVAEGLRLMRVGGA